MGEANFRTPTPPKPLNGFRCHVKYITTSPQRDDVQNLVGINSSADLRMRKKNMFCVNFFYYHIYLSICTFFCRGYRSHFGAILTLNGSNEVISQPLVPFCGHINIASY